MGFIKKMGITLIILISLPGFLQNSAIAAVEKLNLEKITICHVPPGNHDNAKTISVASSAVPSHLAHGDSNGACTDDFLVDARINRSYGIIGTVFDISAIIVSPDNAAASYEWLLSDGRSFTGENISVSFSETGFFEITLTATSGSGTTSVADVGVIVHNSTSMSPDILGLPNLLGDVNGDGEITLVDAHLAAKFVGRVNALSAEQQDAVDMDLSSVATFKDVGLIASAILGSSTLPNQLLTGQGAPGTVVTLVSPSLLNPEDFVEISFGGTQVQKPNRPIMGYVSFIVPFVGDAATPGLKEIKLLLNGTEASSYEFTVLEAEALPQDPAAEVALFLGELQSLLKINEALVSKQLNEYTISDLTRTTLLAAATAGRAKADEVIAQLLPLLSETGGGELAKAFFMTANANGLSEYRARVQKFNSALSGITNQTTDLQLVTALATISPDAVCDNLLPALCALKQSASLLDAGSGAVSFACDVLLAAGLGAAIFPGDGPLLEGALLSAWASACAPLEFAIDAAAVITGLVSNIDADLRLTASTNSPASGETAIITAALDVFGIDDICQIAGSKGASKVVDVLAERLVNRLIMRKITVRAMTQIFTQLGEKFLQKFLGLLESAAGSVITSSGIDSAILEFAQPYCEDIFGAELVMDASRVLTGPEPNEGTLSFLSDGTAEYSCPETPSSTDPLVVAFTAEKDICGVVEKKTINIKCATRDVTITMGDNGSLNDDIYEVRLDGVTILTTSSPVRSASVTESLVVGSIHQVQMLGRAAPDGIGTYYIRFSGAVVTSGDRLSGSDLVPGAAKNFIIKVLP